MTQSVSANAVDTVGALADKEDEGDDQDVERECQDNVHEAHHDRIQPAAEIAAQCPDQRPEGKREEQSKYADLQIGASPVQQPGPDIPAELVRAEPVRRAQT